MGSLIKKGSIILIILPHFKQIKYEYSNSRNRLCRPLIVNGNARIGDNCTIRPDVVNGYKDRTGPSPIIGNNVTINSGSRIIGNGIVVGDNVIIAPGAVVTKSIPSNSVVAGVPAKVIKELSEK